MNTKTADVFNRCVGDIDMTLNREIMLKSFAYPNKHIGHHKKFY